MRSTTPSVSSVRPSLARRGRVPVRGAGLALLAGGVIALGGFACAEQDAQVRSTRRPNQWAWNPRPAHSLEELIAPASAAAPTLERRGAMASEAPAPVPTSRPVQAAAAPAEAMIDLPSSAPAPAPTLAAATAPAAARTESVPAGGTHAAVGVAPASEPAKTAPGMALTAPGALEADLAAALNGSHVATVRPAKGAGVAVAPRVDAKDLAAITAAVAEPSGEAGAPKPAPAGEVAALPAAAPAAEAAKPEPIVIIVPSAKGVEQPTSTGKAETPKAEAAGPEKDEKGVAEAAPARAVAVEPEAKPAPAPAVVAKSEPAPAPKAEPVAVAKTEPKAETKIAPKPEVKAEPKPEAAVAAKPVAEAEAAKAEAAADSPNFNAPPLQLAVRRPYGSAAAGATVPPAGPKPSAPSDTWVKVFGGATAACAVGTGVLVGALGLTTDGLGRRRWGFTLGSKLALGFGLISTLLMILALVASVSQRNTAVAAGELRGHAEAAQRLAGLDAAVLEVRLASRTFRSNPTDENLDRFTKAVGVARTRLAGCGMAMGATPQAASLQTAAKALDAYEASFREAVGVIDERAGTLASQIDPAVEQIGTLVGEIVRRAEKGGDAKTVAQAEGVRAGALRARAAMEAAVREGDAALAAGAKKIAEETAADARALAERLNRRPGAAWAGPAAQWAGFLADRAGRVGELGARQTEIERAMAGGPVAAIGAVTEELGRGLGEAQAAAAGRVEAERARAATMMAGIAGAAVVMGVLAGGLTVRSVAGRAKAVLAAVRALSESDLSRQPINSTAKDELGELARAVDRLGAGLRDVMTEVTISTTEVAGAAAEIAGGTQRMSASVQEVARRCAEAAGTAADAGASAAAGGETVRRAVEGLRELDAAVRASAETVSALGQRGLEVAGVIGVLNEIADQTNLLALSAAMEAASAGEHGKGFTLVADRARALAERTTRATEEVHACVRAMQEEAQRACQRIDAGTERAREGVALAERASEALEGLVAGSSGVAGLVRSISAAAEGAGGGVGQSVSAASQLSAKAEQLMAMVGRFNLGSNDLGRVARKHGKTPQAAPPPAAGAGGGLFRKPAHAA
jgi:methyl-accepting chemotaxis protein